MLAGFECLNKSIALECGCLEYFGYMRVRAEEEENLREAIESNLYTRQQRAWKTSRRQ